MPHQHAMCAHVTHAVVAPVRHQRGESLGPGPALLTARGRRATLGRRGADDGSLLRGSPLRDFVGGRLSRGLVRRSIGTRVGGGEACAAAIHDAGCVRVGVAALASRSHHWSMVASLTQRRWRSSRSARGGELGGLRSASDRTRRRERIFATRDDLVKDVIGEARRVGGDLRAEEGTVRGEEFGGGGLHGDLLQKHEVRLRGGAAERPCR